MVCNFYRVCDDIGISGVDNGVDNAVFPLVQSSLMVFQRDVPVIHTVDPMQCG